MRTVKATRGPFARRPYFDNAEMESMCLDALSSVGLLPSRPEPIRIDRFVEKRFDISVDYASLPEGVLGFTEFGSDGPKAVYVAEKLESNRNQPAQRRVRSTIAHEAGHCLFHSQLFTAPEEPSLFPSQSGSEPPKVLCRDEAIERQGSGYDGQWWEFQANAGMGHLLMPRPLVLSVVKPFLVRVGALGVDVLLAMDRSSAIEQLVKVFDVNPAVARIQLSSLFPEHHASQAHL